jgi:hypothetical protein
MKKSTNNLVYENYDYVDNTFDDFNEFEKIMINFIESHGDSYHKSKLIDICDVAISHSINRWMYYKNEKEFIFEYDRLEDIENFDNCYYVDTIKITPNEDENEYGEIDAKSFVCNNACLKKYNKNVIFKMIKNINIPFDVFKMIYPLLIPHTNCELVCYKNYTDMMDKIYECICCTKSNTKFIKFKTIDEFDEYNVCYVVMDNDPLVVFKDVIGDFQLGDCAVENYKSAILNRGDASSCIMCYTQIQN